MEVPTGYTHAVADMQLYKVAYGGVRNMLNGKAWPKAVGGLRMVAVAFLDDFINCGAPQSKHLSTS